MHPHFADGALPLQVGVGLTRMAVTLRRCGCSAVAPSVAEAMEAGFLPALDKDQADMLTPSQPAVGVAPVTTCTGLQVTDQGYPGLSHLIW